ncbi:hypothetical protein [Marinobacterium lacunae]|uniref:hypothetical protein n=1 Tax=Marinobacterium lacunae TaxID=1232683 RepID=UPI00055DFA50|nr:hypothetical protein [Marinobacterium lacunae]
MVSVMAADRATRVTPAGLAAQAAWAFWRDALNMGLALLEKKQCFNLERFYAICKAEMAFLLRTVFIVPYPLGIALCEQETSMRRQGETFSRQDG